MSSGDYRRQVTDEAAWIRGDLQNSGRLLGHRRERNELPSPSAAAGRRGTEGGDSQTGDEFELQTGCQSPTLVSPVQKLFQGDAMPDDMPLGRYDESYFHAGARLAPSAGRTRVGGELSALAVVSLVLGAISPFLICLCYIALLPSLGAIVTGHVAHFRIRRSAGALRGTGLSIAGLVLGYAAFTITALLLGISLYGLSTDDGANMARAPGELELLEVEQQIVSDDEGYALGNTPEARELARRFADEMKVLDETLFTQTDAGGTLSGGQYVTWCELRDGQCAFVVHVPEYRRFEAEAKEALADLAWMTAEDVVSETLEPGDDLAVGLKGVLLYGAVMVGRVEGADEETAAGLVESDADKSALYPFFLGNAPAALSAQKERAPDRVAMKSPRPGERGAPVEVDPTPDARPAPRRPPTPPEGERPRPEPPEEGLRDPPAHRTRPERTRSRIRPESVEEALEFLDEEDEFLQQQAVSFLAQQEPDEPNPAVVDALFGQLERDHSGGRFFIATALRTWATADDLERLEPLIDDENVLVQTHTVETIARLDTKEAAEVLAERLTDEDDYSRVSFALSRMGSVAEDPVLAQLGNDHLDVVRTNQIIFVLGEVGGRKSYRALQRVAADRRNPSRFAAQTASDKIQRRLAN